MEKQQQPQTAKEVQQQIESKNVLLMDNMEAGVRDNGQFFWKVGEKPTDTNASDNRALIFKKNMERTEDTNFSGLRKGTFDLVVATREGLKILNLEPDKLDEFVRMIDDHSDTIKFEPGKVSTVIPGDKDVGILFIASKGETGLPTAYHLREPWHDKDHALIDRSMSESIRVARETMAEKAKEQAALELKLKELAETDELLKRFNALTQKSTNPEPPVPAPTNTSIAVNKDFRGENSTEQERAFWEFKKTAERYGSQLAKIGDTLILPNSVLSTDISPRPFLIGANPKVGKIRIDAGDGDTAGEIIKKRMVISPEQQQEIANAIAAYNKNLPIEKQIQEGIQEIADGNGKGVKFALWNQDWKEFFVSLAELSPRQNAVDTALAKNVRSIPTQP